MEGLLEAREGCRAVTRSEERVPQGSEHVHGKDLLPRSLGHLQRTFETVLRSSVVGQQLIDRRLTCEARALPQRIPRGGKQVTRPLIHFRRLLIFAAALEQPRIGDKRDAEPSLVANCGPYRARTVERGARLLESPQIGIEPAPRQ